MIQYTYSYKRMSGDRYAHTYVFIYMLINIYTYIYLHIYVNLSENWLENTDGSRQGFFCIYLHLNPVHEPLAKNHMTYLNSRRKNFTLSLCPQKEET